MIKWFINRKREKEVLKFEQLLVEQLSSFLPNMKEMRNHSKLLNSHTTVNHIFLTYGMYPAYYDQNKKKHKVYYRLNGVQIRKINTGEYVQLPIVFSHDLINSIEIDHPHDFWKHYDIQSIRLTDLVKTDIPTTNQDEVKLRKILKGVEEYHLQKIEVDDTFEIEVEGAKYYTILDMEDGNYIAVNSRGKVFRLDHDSDEPVELINKSIKDFLESFSGDKTEIGSYFDT